MAFKRKCKYCGRMITDETDAVDYKGGYVHSSCFSIALKAVQEQRVNKVNDKVATKAKVPKTSPVKIPKKGMSEEEYQEKTDYYNFIKKVLGNQLPAKIFALTEKYKEQYRDSQDQPWTYAKMRQALVYCLEVKEKELTDDCVGLIPYYYDEAAKYYEQLSAYQKNVQSSIGVLQNMPHAVVRINPHTKKSVKQINIEEIGVI